MVFDLDGEFPQLDVEALASEVLALGQMVIVDAVNDAEEAREQWRGLAVESVAAEIRRRRGTRMYVTWEPGEGGPEGFYRKLGFQLTGEKSGGQTVGALDLTHPS
ncbi:hypothetical protein GCM10023075_28770 [Streptosporangium album]